MNKVALVQVWRSRTTPSQQQGALVKPRLNVFFDSGALPWWNLFIRLQVVFHDLFCGKYEEPTLSLPLTHSWFQAKSTQPHLFVRFQNVGWQVVTTDYHWQNKFQMCLPSQRTNGPRRASWSVASATLMLLVRSTSLFRKASEMEEWIRRRLVALRQL